MKVGYYQFDVKFGDKEYNLKKVINKLGSKDVESDIIVLPELFLSGYLFINKEEVIQLSDIIMESIYLKQLKELSKDKKMYIFGGFIENDNNKYYNSSILFNPFGQDIVYRKLHLFNEEKIYFETSNSELKSHKIILRDNQEVKIGLMICFDWFFPETMRTLALDGAQIILHTANLVLPYCPDAMITRCLENRVFAVVSNRIGIESRGNKTFKYIGLSEIVTPKGEILHRSPEDSEELFITEVNPNEANNKKINSYNDLFMDRRIDKYKIC